MKTLILFTFLSLLNMLGTESCNPPVSEPPCDSSLWKHTYGPMERFGDPPERNKLFHRCVTIEGLVDSVSKDGDGDYKMKLRLYQSNFTYGGGPYNRSDILNQFNERDEGRLVVEIVCGAPQTFDKTDPKNQKMVDACKGYSYQGYKPLRGQSVSVTGELVTDMGPCAARPRPEDNCHGWKEIHPVTSIKQIFR